jgi:hypothetical protein
MEEVMTKLGELGRGYRRGSVIDAAIVVIGLATMSGCASAPAFGDASSGGGSDGSGSSRPSSGHSATSGVGGGPSSTSVAATSGVGAGQSSSSGAGGAPGSPSLTIYSGDGGVVPSGWPAGDPLRVLARDGAGQPVVNADVTFDTGGNAIHIQAFNDVATTDATGVAGTTYNAFPIDGNEGMEVDEVTASWNGLSVVFHVIITQVPSGWPAAPPLVHIGTPDTAPDYGTAHAGATIPGALLANAVIQQGPDYGVGVPNWGLRITSSDDILQPAAVGCAGGTVFSDASGNISCDLVAPSTPGDYGFSVLAAGSVRFDNGHLHVVP